MPLLICNQTADFHFKYMITRWESDRCLCLRLRGTLCLVAILSVVPDSARQDKTKQVSLLHTLSH